jgi:hypothetical protein
MAINIEVVGVVMVSPVTDQFEVTSIRDGNRLRKSNSALPGVDHAFCTE